MSIDSHPILSFEEAQEVETRVLGGNESLEWEAIQKAGRGVAEGILRDCWEVGGFSENGSLLVLVGKGHNGADALVAADAILERFPKASVDLLFVFGLRVLRPLTDRAYRLLDERHPGRVRLVRVDALGSRYTVALDGVFGLKFRKPLAKEAKKAFEAATRIPTAFRASVDVPSGLSERGAFRADFTYATGSMKEPLLGCENAGRPRYVPIGLVDETAEGDTRVLLPSTLSPLAALRAASLDKRKLGHLVVLGGSEGYPGAVLMSVLGALHSGVGLVTAFVPQSVAAAYAARLPEVMWVGWPTHAEGGLSVEGQDLWEQRIGRASAVVVGPGLGRSKETHALLADLLGRSQVPWVLDADALMPDLVRMGKVSKILTPHAGEFERIAKGRSPSALSVEANATVVVKGPITRICTQETTYVSLAGGPVLSRGGSGDILSGMAGGLLAQSPKDPVQAACRAALWHGLSADALARAKGQVAVTTTELLDYMGPVLRSIGP